MVVLLVHNDIYQAWTGYIGQGIGTRPVAIQLTGFGMSSVALSFSVYASHK